MKLVATGFFVLMALLSQAQKFAYIDSKYVLSHIPEYQQAQAEINKLSSQWQKDIENKYETIAKLETSLQAEKILLTDEMKQKRELEIQTKRQEAKDMQKSKFGINGELFKKREELVKPIQDLIYEAIQEVATTSALMVVFDKSSDSNMLYTNPKHDISDKVLKKMGLKPGETIDDEEGGEGGEVDEQGQKTDSKAPGAPGKNATPPKGGERVPIKDK